MKFKKIFSIILLSIIVFDVVKCAVVSLKETVKRAAVGPVWSTKKIPYAFSNIIDFDFDDRAKIKAVLLQIQESLSTNGELCVEFVERTNEKDYILFVDKGDCSSGIGFFPGINNISLARQCLTTGTIIHEVVHRLGFDHEHSRHDRDQHVKILSNNSLSSLNSNFEKNPNSNDVEAPYDYHSIIHYNSDALQKNSEPTIISKVPVLISDANEIYHFREKLTPIDIYKIQRFYKCPTIPIPEIIKENDSIEEEKVEKINERFKLETKFKGISEEVVGQYLEKTYSTCGIGHYWPPNYPLVESSHRLYKLMCNRKKQVKESCQFSIECLDELSVCVRPLFLRSGFCVRPENERVNRITQTVNDSMFKFGIKVKDTFKKIKSQMFGIN